MTDRLPKPNYDVSPNASLNNVKLKTSLDPSAVAQTHRRNRSYEMSNNGGDQSLNNEDGNVVVHKRRSQKRKNP